MVDYRKWDALDVSDDEEANPKPRVTKFDQPQRVTMGKPQESTAVVEEVVDEDELMEPDEADPSADSREDVLELRGLAERAQRGGDAKESVRLLEKAMRMGGASCPGLEDDLRAARAQVTKAECSASAPLAVAASAESQEPMAKASRNGAVVADRYCWSQTEQAIEVHLFVPEGTKAKDVALNVTDGALSITVGGSPLLKGEWEFKVVVEEELDWEMVNLEGRRAVRLAAPKAAIPGGFSVVAWWSCVLKGEPTIDVKTIKDRKAQAQEGFQQAWKDAHAQFREKVAQRSPIEIDADGNFDMGQ